MTATGIAVLGIKARRIFDGERVIADGSVVLVDGSRIADVLPPGARLPAGCAVTDFPEATLLPGLIDAHVHLCCDSGNGALSGSRRSATPSWSR